jgi:predicted nucleic-acid-binding Zn-ribbon protein
MKKFILVVLVLVGLVSFGNSQGCFEKGAFKSISVTSEKVEVFDILVIDASEVMFFTKCGDIQDLIQNNVVKIKSTGKKFSKLEKFQLLIYFSKSTKRGKYTVFSTKKKLSEKKKKVLLKENGIIEYYIFLDEE